MEMMGRCYGDHAEAKASEAPQATPSASPVASPAPAASPAASVELTEKPSSDSVAHYDPDGGRGSEPEPATERCWADYCPCDKSDPDYGGLDITLCRELRMGHDVSDSRMSNAAGNRDMRRMLRENQARYRESVREWKAENGGDY
jgi:hypothetical protein